MAEQLRVPIERGKEEEEAARGGEEGAAASLGGGEVDRQEL